MNTIELIKDAAFFGGHIPNERLDECRNFFDNVIEKQLTLTDVGNCPFEAYAVFCIECDRQGMKPIIYKDYLNLG